MATEKISIIDTDSAQAGWDYSTLDAWEDDFGSSGGVTSGDLPTNDEIAVAEVCASSGTDDTAVVVILNDWTTDATRYVEVRLHSSETNNGLFNDANYVFHNNDTDVIGINVRAGFVRFVNFQVKVTETGGNSRRGIEFNTIPNPSNYHVDSCFFKGVVSGTGSAYGIHGNDGNNTLNIFNSIFTDFYISGDGGFAGIFNTNGTVNIFNSTVYNCHTGIREFGGTVNAYNTAVFNCDDDTNGLTLLNECGTEDGDDSGNNGNFTITQTADDYAALVADAAGGDFNVTDDSSELYNTGDGSSTSLFTDDIKGTTRGPADADWDVGAFEYVAAGGGISIPLVNSGLVNSPFIGELVS